MCLEASNIQVKIFLLAFLSFCLCNCRQAGETKPVSVQQADSNNLPTYSYHQVKDSIVTQRKNFSAKNTSLKIFSKKENTEEVVNFWIKSIGRDLYDQWEHTPWDFNGTAKQPNEGSIACGYFVTTILKDMGCNINRTKLAICASSVMMKTIAPQQKIQNFSYFTYVDFDKKLKYSGKGVYIIGLDFHTGFIVNDGHENWFIHSNYVNGKGVMKEAVLNSAALKSSKTRWVISLTKDTGFLYKWIKG